MAKDRGPAAMNNFSNERDIIPVWHSLQPAEASKLLKVNPQLGLATAEVTERLSLYGENKLAEKPKRPRLIFISGAVQEPSHFSFN